MVAWRGNIVVSTQSFRCISYNLRFKISCFELKKKNSCDVNINWHEEKKKIHEEPVELQPG